MNNIILFVLHAVIAVFVIIPMFLVLFAVKFVRVSYYAVKHNILQIEPAHSPVAHE
ncbi:MAG TPA: hypothetical protein VGC08_08385 [Pedobacter sp.]